jgi:hypothetical protein
VPPDVAGRGFPHDDDVPQFLIHHRHEPTECGAVFASFQGFVSPVRRQPAPASCRHGGHDIWWFVEADTAAHALDLVPRYVAERAVVTRVERLVIP